MPRRVQNRRSQRVIRLQGHNNRLNSSTENAPLATNVSQSLSNVNGSNGANVFDQSDIPEERYFMNPNAVSVHLYCSICQEVFVEPYRAPCGHSYCKKCISEWLQGNSTCPEDRKSLHFSSMHKDFILENIIGDYKVACPYRALGCDHVGPLHVLRSHKDKCSLNPHKMPKVLQEYTKNILEQTTSSLASKSQKPATLETPSSSAPVITVSSVLDTLMSDSNIGLDGDALENLFEQVQVPVTCNSTDNQEQVLSSNMHDLDNNDDDEDNASHLPEMALPSLRMRLYVAGSETSRDLLCNFLETTNTTNSVATTSSGAADVVTTYKKAAKRSRCEY